ncbi:hypothetical protein ABIB62_003712 [Mucilaginibacter sp. UYP25]
MHNNPHKCKRAVNAGYAGAINGLFMLQQQGGGHEGYSQNL